MSNAIRVEGLGMLRFVRQIILPELAFEGKSCHRVAELPIIEVCK